MEFRAHGYQKRMIEFLINTTHAGLFLSMGLGKTVITLTAIWELMYDRFEIQKVLVIAPKRVAEDTWSREHAKWDHLKDLRISKVLGSPAQRRKALEADADIYVIGRDNVVWLVEYYLALKKGWPFDMVVIDELSSFKNPQAKRFRALRKAMPYTARVVGLTGTPSPNGLMDLWAEIYLLDRGHRNILITEYGFNEKMPVKTAGYMRAFQERGLSSEYAHILDLPFGVDTSALIAGAIVSNNATAIITSNSPMTISALKACKNQGLEIPRDISFIAYDDSPWMDLLNITAMTHPMEDIGKSMADMLYKMLDDSAAPPRPVSLEVKPYLLLRNSIRQVEPHP